MAFHDMFDLLQGWTQHQPFAGDVGSSNQSFTDLFFTVPKSEIITERNEKIGCHDQMVMQSNQQPTSTESLFENFDIWEKMNLLYMIIANIGLKCWIY